MPGLTPHFQLTKLYPGDSFSVNGQQYTSADRDTIDRLVYLGAEGHHHDGAAAVEDDPTSPASLALDQSQGHLPAGTRVTYVYTYVDPSGAETAPSPPAFLDLPAPVSAPVGPGATALIGTGTLQPGGYFYVLSAYSGTNTQETAASPPAYVTLTATGSNVLTLPLLPSGATGFNVYRLAPAEASYVYLASIAMTGATPPATWTDNGSYTETPNRLAPSQNTTQATNNITVTLPAPPPVGWTWNLYRTLVVGVWANSLLAQISALDGTGHIIVVYQDLGLSTNIGTPPVSSRTVASPTKIMLTGGAEVQGILPGSMVAGGVVGQSTVEFEYPGTVTTGNGVSVWVCPFNTATIVNVIATLGRASAPAAQPLIADVLKGSGATPTYTSLYSGATPNPKPTIAVGTQVSPEAPPNVTTLVAGDSLTTAITQAGGGATPTDKNLNIVVLLQVTS